MHLAGRRPPLTVSYQSMQRIIYCVLCTLKSSKTVLIVALKSTPPHTNNCRLPKKKEEKHEPLLLKNNHFNRTINKENNTQTIFLQVCVKRRFWFNCFQKNKMFGGWFSGNDSLLNKDVYLYSQLNVMGICGFQHKYIVAEIPFLLFLFNNQSVNSLV